MRGPYVERPLDTRGVQVRLLHGQEVADLKAALKAKKAEMLQTMTGIPDHSFKARAPSDPSVVLGNDPRMSTSTVLAECRA